MMFHRRVVCALVCGFVLTVSLSAAESVNEAKHKPGLIARLSIKKKSTSRRSLFLYSEHELKSVHVWLQGKWVKANKEEYPYKNGEEYHLYRVVQRFTPAVGQTLLVNSWSKANDCTYRHKLSIAKSGGRYAASIDLTKTRTREQYYAATNKSSSIQKNLEQKTQESKRPIVQSSNKPFQFMSPEKERRYRTYFPNVDDENIQQLLKDPRLILYTDSEIPPAYQDWDGNLQGVHSIHYNISANGSEPYGNGNREFPWGAPGGLHRTSNVGTFRFLSLPADATGDQRPIVWYKERMRGDTRKGYVWLFPVGTVVGEVLRMKSPSGKYYTFEMRMRVREQDDWGIDVYRPFRNAESLAQRIKELRPAWRKQPKLAKLVKHLEEPMAMAKQTLSDRKHPRKAFRQTSGIDQLPAIDDDELVAELLTTTPFKSVVGEIWRKGTNGLTTAAATTDARFHVVPAKYDAGFIDVDRKSCIRCHETASRHVNKFDFSRDWYGRVRGSDGIFSFHPFDRGCISRNGFGMAVRMNQKLIAAGVLERINREKHPKSVYRTVSHLRN